MPFKVKWTTEAQSQFHNILDYWNEKIGSQTYSNKLIKVFENSISTLSVFPKMGHVTDNARIRVKVIKDYFLYYSFENDTITILGVSDMRRNPNYLKSLIV